MKILHWNILDGCAEPDRLNAIGKFISNYDIVCLNELNDWNEDNKIERFAKQWDYPYFYLKQQSVTGHFVGVLSRVEFTIVAHNNEQVFHHGLLHISIDFIWTDIFITHLTPLSAEKRILEANEIVKRAKKVQDRPVLLLGDLNTLSQLDAQVYKENNVIDT
jgi:endonuclease/exonuclease/phosphatase family metal-dependent hydrolase